MGNSLSPQVPYMNQNNEGDSQETTWCDVITNWWRWVPIFTRFLIYTSLLLSLFGIFFPVVVETLMNFPELVYKEYEIWRVITAPVANYGILMLFFGLISYIPVAMRSENIKGTTKFIIYFMTLSIISQILLLILDFVLQLMIKFPSISDGLWTMVIIEVTIDAIREPNATRVFFWFPIPAIYLPFIYLLIFGLLSPIWLCALVWGCLTGWLYGFGLLSCLDPGKGWIDKVNSYFLFPFLSFSTFAKEYEGTSSNQNNIRNESSTGNILSRSNTQHVTPFSGRGVMVGESVPLGSYPNSTRTQPQQASNPSSSQSNILSSVNPSLPVQTKSPDLENRQPTTST